MLCGVAKTKTVFENSDRQQNNQLTSVKFQDMIELLRTMFAESHPFPVSSLLT